MKITKTIILLLSLTLLVVSCVKEDIYVAGSVSEGDQALVSLNMSMAQMGSKTLTRALTPEQETKINDLRVMIFNGAGRIVTNKKFVGNLGTSIQIDTYSGNNCKIYVVANVGDAGDQQLAAATTVDDVIGAMTTATGLGFGLNSTKPLLMTGSVESVNIQPGSSSISDPIQLHFLAAKVTLNVIDKTGPEEMVTILGWDVVDVPKNSYVFPHTVDANPSPETNNSDDLWLTTTSSSPFETTDIPNKSAQQVVYLLENRRGGRTNRNLPDDPNRRYPGMAFTDTDHKGKAWYAPKRATAIVIYAMHKTPTETKQVKAYIYIGTNNHGNYDIERGTHYEFTATVNGFNDINIDSSVDYPVGNFKVDYGTNLIMDAHPDFRPMRIHAPQGMATIEILDGAGRSCKDPGFNAAWLKISPLNLMYHQVKQSAPNSEWQQQAGTVGSFVRGKYIPHKAVRDALSAKGGWNAVPTGFDDDDVMSFSDATYRMCYKIEKIPFTEASAVTNKTLCVYADEFLSSGGTRVAKVKVTFLKEGDKPENAETRTFDVSQNGYLTIYDESNPEAGLDVLNQDGTPSGRKKKFIIEQYEEVEMIMNPGIPPNVQMTYSMQWGFYGLSLYNNDDKYRNGYLLTANAVYTDVSRISNQPTGFGINTNSYRDMYGGASSSRPIQNYSVATAPPYYYPAPTDVIYHPIYKSSAARYCHEKNRDINGDGYIDASETHWYLPSQHELQMIWITGMQGTFGSGLYWSATEDASNYSWYVGFTGGGTASNTKTSTYRVRCVREI
ncbi:DUF4906 domain-containing protein [Bacteroides sp.]|uniref:DUF4906 domain-containing protein n=1 Tax=Bacteroides sp. TaxID=29523 RepID=UPI002FC754EC